MKVTKAQLIQMLDTALDQWALADKKNHNVHIGHRTCHNARIYLQLRAVTRGTRTAPPKTIPAQAGSL